MVTEIAALTEVKRRLERALAETEGPLQVRVEGIFLTVCVTVNCFLSHIEYQNFLSCVIGAFCREYLYFYKDELYLP